MKYRPNWHGRHYIYSIFISSYVCLETPTPLREEKGVREGRWVGGWERERDRERGGEGERGCVDRRIVHQSIGAQMGYCAQSGLNYSGVSNYDPSVKASYFWASDGDQGGVGPLRKTCFYLIFSSNWRHKWCSVCGPTLRLHELRFSSSASSLTCSPSICFRGLLFPSVKTGKSLLLHYFVPQFLRPDALRGTFDSNDQFPSHTRSLVPKLNSWHVKNLLFDLGIDFKSCLHVTCLCFHIHHLKSGKRQTVPSIVHEAGLVSETSDP